MTLNCSLKSALPKSPTSANALQRPHQPPDSSSSYSSDDEGRKVKRRRKIAGLTATSNIAPKQTNEDLEATKFAADRSSQIQPTNDATKQSNWFDESDSDRFTAKDLLGTIHARPTAPGEAENDGTYKGTSQLPNLHPKKPQRPNQNRRPR